MDLKLILDLKYLIFTLMGNNAKCLIVKLVVMIAVFSSYAQQMTPNTVDSLTVESIKETIWIPFMESYKELDVTKLVSLYANDVTRVALDLNKIEDRTEFSESMSFFLTESRL